MPDCWYGGYDGGKKIIQEINMVGRERLAYLYGLYSGYADAEAKIGTNQIYQRIASELAWCLGLDKSTIGFCEQKEE